MKESGRRIFDLRSDLGMTQAELAGKVGVASNTIVQYEKGISKMSVEVLFGLALALRTNADYILCLTDTP